MTPRDNNLRTLVKDILSSYDDRIKTVGEIASQTHTQISDFRKQREETTKELKDILARGEFLRRKDFDQIMAGVISNQNLREEEVKKMLEDFRHEEEAMAARLKGLLKKGESVRIKDFKKTMLDVRQEQEKRLEGAKETKEAIGLQLDQMRQDVKRLLSDFKGEREAAASLWAQLTGLLIKKKNAWQKQQ